MRLLKNSVWEIPRGLFSSSQAMSSSGSDLISTDLAIWDEMISLISFVPSDDSFFYPLSRFRCVLVFPHLEMSPPGSFQSLRGIGIPFTVRRYLRLPRELISLWRDEVCGTAMPEASVHVNDDLRSHKHDVMSAIHIRQNPTLQSETKAFRMQRPPERDLRTGIPGPLGPHLSCDMDRVRRKKLLWGHLSTITTTHRAAADSVFRHFFARRYF